MLRFLIAVSLSVVAAYGARGDTILRVAGVVDGTGEVLAANSIRIDGTRIAAIGVDLMPGEGDTVLDYSDLYAMPGMIDAHTHITYGLEAGSKGNAWQEAGQQARDARFRAALKNGLATLSSGVTTIRDLNDGSGLDFELRTLFASGSAVGPRVFTSGGGVHPSRQVDGLKGPDAVAVAYATAQLDAGADWIKVFATTGSADDLTSTAYYTPETIAALADLARARSKRITLHSYGPEAVDAAIAARVHSIDHPVGMSPAQLAGLKAANIIYVPTADHNRYYADHRHEYGYGEETDANLRAFVARNVAAITAAHKAGVTIAMGSDAVFSGFGSNICELKQFQAAGLDTASILQTATVNGATLLGMERDLGRVQPGYIADLVLVAGNPAQDLDRLFDGIRHVYKDGRLVYSAGPAAKPVDCGSAQAAG